MAASRQIAATDLAAFGPVASASPPVTPFLWSGSSSTATPATSAAYSQPPAASTINVIAGSGVTNLVAQVQATNDPALATGWTTIATVNLSALGTASVVCAIPYFGLRVNVTALAGGNASANLTAGQSPLANSAGTVLSNPALTGVPVPGPFILAQWGVAVILPSSGSIGNNGALTLTTALPSTFAICWMYFPANAIASGSVAGIYYVQMSSTTAGTIFNNLLTAGMSPSAIPASPTAFSTTGPGAYTQTTGGVVGAVQIPLVGGSMGANGALRYKGVWLRPNNANSITSSMTLGGTQISFLSNTNQFWLGFERTLRNMGDQAKQISIAAGTSGQTDATLSGSPTSFLTINTAATQMFGFTFYIGTATDYLILAAFNAEILPAS